MAFKVSKKFQDMIDRNNQISADTKAVEERWKSWTPPNQNTNDIFQDTQPSYQPTKFQQLKEIPNNLPKQPEKIDWLSLQTYKDILTPAKKTEGLNFDPNFDSVLSAKLKKNINIDPNSVNPFLKFLLQTSSKTGEQAGDNLITAAVNKKLKKPLISPTRDTTNYNLNPVANVGTDILGTAGDPISWLGGPVAGKVGGAIRGSAKLAKAGKLSKFAVPLAGEGAVFGGMLSAGNEAKNYINNPDQFNLGSSVGKTIGGATTGALGNIALGGLLHGIGSGIKGINQIKNLKGKTIDLKASEVPKEWGSYPSSPYIPPQPKQYSGQFTVNTNRVAQQAQQDLEDAIVAVQNHFGTNQLTADEIARIKPELGIDFEQLINRVENPQVDIRGIGERAKYGQHIGLNNVMARPDQSLYNLKYPRDIIPEPRPLQTPVFNQQQPQINPSKFQVTGNLPTLQQEVINQFKKPILKEVPSNRELPKKKEIVNNPLNESVVSPNNQSIPNIPVTQNEPVTGLNNANKPNSIISDIVKQQESNIPQQNILSTPIQNQFDDNISKFRTNTLERYTKLTPEEKAQLNPKEYEYIKESNKEWQETAAKNVEKDMHEVMNRLFNQESLTGGVDAAEGAAVGMKLLEKARATKDPADFSAYMSWTELIAEKTRENSRAMKATDLSYDKSTPAGAVMKAQRVINSVIPDEMVPKINAEAKKIKLELKRVDNDALDQIAKEFDDIINSKDFKYEMAKEIAPSVPDKNLDRFIKSNLKEMGVNVGKLVREFKNQDKINDITAYMVKNSGLSEPEATALANQIKTRLAQITADKKQQIVTNMFKDRPKAIKKTDFDKTMELINLGAYDDTTLKNLVKKKENLPVLEPEEAQKIIEHMDNAQKIKDKNSYEYKKEIAMASDIMAEKLPTTWKDYYLALRNVSMLGNLKTGIRNIIGNAGLIPGEFAKNVVSAPIDKLVSLKTGQRTTFFPTLESGKVYAKGFKKGVKETTFDLKSGVNTNPTPGQFEINRKQVLKNIPVAGKVLAPAERATSAMLAYGDRPFYQATYDKTLAQLMKDAKVKEPMQDMLDIAKKVAEDVTYVNDSSLSKAVQKIKSGMGPIGDVVIPYTKTPANILDKTLDYLPTGFAKALFELGKGSKKLEPIYKGLYTQNKAGLKFDQKKFVDRLGRALVGSGVIAGTTQLGKQGKITGEPNQSQALAGIEKQAGKLPYAYKTDNNKYITYDWAQPLSTLIATGANLGNNKLTKEQAMLKSANLIQNQSFVRGIGELLDKKNNNSLVTGVYNALVKSPGQFNPTLLKQYEKTSEPYVKEKSGQPKINVLGQPVKTMYGNNTVINSFLNPATTANYNPTKSEKLIIDLANRTGDTKFLPTEQDEKIRVDNKDVKLTPEQLTKFRKTIGLNLDKLYKQIANNKTFIQSSDKDKMTILNNFKDKIVSDAKDNIMDSKNKMSNYNNEAISKKQFEMVRDEIYKNIDSKYKLTKDQNGKIIKDVNYDRNTKAKQDIQEKISAKKTNNMSEQQKLELIKSLRKLR